MIYNKTMQPPKSVLSRVQSLLKLSGQLALSEVKKKIRKESGLRLDQATLIVEELGKLKGAAMKLGQLLALEARNYLPDEICQILEKLQSNASFLDKKTVHMILKEQLNDYYYDIKNISDEPIAAASIGQVHSGILDDTPVAIKVQYPGIRDSIESDMKILSSLLKALGKILKRNTDFTDLLNEFSSIFIQETDYLLEATFAQQIKEKALNWDAIHIPTIYKNHSTHQILTMSFENGKTLPNWIREDQPNEEIKEFFATVILELYTKEFCEWGLVQTDPNLGNFLIHAQSRKLIALDFGATKAYNQTFRIQYAKLVMAAYLNHPLDILELAYAMNLLSPKEPKNAQATFIELISESMRPMQLQKFDFKDNTYHDRIQKLTHTLVSQLKYSPPPKNLIFLHRKLSGIFHMLKILQVAIDLRPYVYEFEKLSQFSV